MAGLLVRVLIGKKERHRETHREIKKCIRLEDFHKALVQVCFFQNPPFDN